ncbi:hypothetical protein Tco_1124081 [Tanacetum coccineum]|uniref:Integrase, catalytic region, zinc finger, CCHC-type, peptidase aspartic, catalytic n=1 Tax=Tanacetum coccineum TaxID=301880 RepID=A0ABQ5J5S3_9ASTR
MTTLVEFMIIAGADNHPPMLEKTMYDSWKSRMELYLDNKENVRMILDSVLNEKLQADCDLKAANIVLQGLPPDVYAIVNHPKVTKDIWDRVKLLMQGTKLSLQEKECKLYDEFDKFSFVKGETLLTQPMIEFFQLDSGLAVPVFSLGDDPIACLNKALAFMTVVVALRQGQSYAGTGNKGEGHMARQCTQPKRPRNIAWFKEKAMLAEALESDQILDEEQLAILVDPGIPDGQAT